MIAKKSPTGIFCFPDVIASKLPKQRYENANASPPNNAVAEIKTKKCRKKLFAPLSLNAIITINTPTKIFKATVKYVGKMRIGKRKAMPVPKIMESKNLHQTIFEDKSFADKNKIK